MTKEYFMKELGTSLNYFKGLMVRLRFEAVGPDCEARVRAISDEALKELALGMALLEAFKKYEEHDGHKRAWPERPGRQYMDGHAEAKSVSDGKIGVSDVSYEAGSDAEYGKTAGHD